jgi:hypothetical protein
MPTSETSFSLNNYTTLTVNEKVKDNPADILRPF